MIFKDSPQKKTIQCKYSRFTISDTFLSQIVTKNLVFFEMGLHTLLTTVYYIYMYVG